MDALYGIIELVAAVLCGIAARASLALLVLAVLTIPALLLAAVARGVERTLHPGRLSAAS